VVVAQVTAAQTKVASSMEAFEEIVVVVAITAPQTKVAVM
jgi:hypothetical protein